jgi:hypothetical protein
MTRDDLLAELRGVRRCAHVPEFCLDTPAANAVLNEYEAQIRAAALEEYKRQADSAANVNRALMERNKALVNERDALRAERDEWKARAEYAEAYLQDATTSGGSVVAEIGRLAARVAKLEAALRRIEKWFGEFPLVTGRDGKPSAFGTEYGSNGERDYMRQIARAALSEASVEYSESRNAICADCHAMTVCTRRGEHTLYRCAVCWGRQDTATEKDECEACADGVPFLRHHTCSEKDETP